MGFWSSLKNKIKKVAKKVWRVVKAVVRVVVRVVMTVVGAVLGIADLLLGFIAWPPKKLRLHIVIPSDQNGPLVNPSDLTPAIDYARKTLKDRFNVPNLRKWRNWREVAEAVPVAVVSRPGAGAAERLGAPRSWTYLNARHHKESSTRLRAAARRTVAKPRRK